MRANCRHIGIEGHNCNLGLGKYGMVVLLEVRNFKDSHAGNQIVY